MASEASTDKAAGRPLSPEIIAAVARLVVSRTYEAGETIIERGRPGEALFIIRQGAAEAVIRDEGGMTIPLARFGPGSYVGEMSVLTGEPTSSDVLALEKSVVSVLPREDVERVLASVPALGRHFAATLADRLRQANLSIWDVHRRQQAMGEFLERGGEEAVLVGESRRARDLRRRVDELGQSDAPTLIVGEAGVGKAMVARCIHQASSRRDGAFIAVDCAALDPEQVREALFGSSDPAVVERFAPRLGYVHLADGGTLLLERIEVLPPEGQADVVTFIDSADGPRTVDPSVSVRVIATSSAPPDGSSDSGQWDAALAARLADNVLEVPPLRQRKRDISAFVEHFLAAHAAASREEPKALSTDAMRVLLSSDYTFGNVQELRESIERAARLADGQVIHAEHIFLGAQVAVERGQYDLFSIGWVERILHHGRAAGALRIAVVAVFGLIAALCLLWPNSESARQANAIVWTVWWPLLLLSMLPIGRLWCTVCPISLAGGLAKRVKCLNIAPPEWMKVGGPVAVLAGFVAIVWVEYVAHMHERPFATALLLLSLMLLAAVVGLVFQRHSWCRYLCPLGGMASTLSLAAPVRLRANRNVCASQCRDHECYKGTETSDGCPVFHHALFVENSHNCKLCFECLQNCPHQSVRVYAQMPMRGLWTEGRVSPLSAAFSVTLAGAALILALSRWTGLPDIALQTATEFSLASVVVLALGLLTFLGLTRVAREPRALETYPWARLCLTFAPLGWAVLLCYHLGTSLPLDDTVVTISSAVSGAAIRTSLLTILHLVVAALGAAMTAATFWGIYTGHFRDGSWTSKVAWLTCVAAVIACGVVGFGSCWRGAGPPL